MAALPVPWLLIVGLAIVVTTISASASEDSPVRVFLRKEVIKKACRYDRDCARHAYCKLQTECACKEGFFVYKEDPRQSEVCLKKVMGVGDDCVESTQCQLTLGPSSECRRGWDGNLCRCVDWAHEVDNRCYNTSRVGGRCVTKNNCLIEGGPPLACAEGVCVCPRLQHGSADGLRCLDNRHLGDECHEDEECITTNSHCMGICECRIHYITDSQNRRCLRVADSVGDMCEEDAQCNRFVPDSECSRSGDCQCRDGFHPGPQGVRCWRSKRLGDPCREDLECLALPSPVAVPHNGTRAVCGDSSCRCAPGYHPDDDGIVCVEGSAVQHAAQTWLLVLVIAAVVSNSGSV